MDIFIHFHQLGQTPELNAVLLLSTVLRCEQRQTEYINTIRPQVLDFYNRLSRALGDTLANADDMKAGGIKLQEVPRAIIVIILLISIIINILVIVINHN